ncbi:hypothetical protein XJ20_03295 [Serratia liquefaciens]|nr:hypothetical protein XJ20_03295 [Serratia liquefaciens]
MIIFKRLFSKNRPRMEINAFFSIRLTTSLIVFSDCSIKRRIMENSTTTQQKAGQNELKESIK